jgi:Bacterial protein of unknown function (DUF899)
VAYRTTGTREEWLAARLELLAAEKELTRRSDELARQRRLSRSHCHASGQHERRSVPRKPATSSGQKLSPP